MSVFLTLLTSLHFFSHGSQSLRSLQDVSSKNFETSQPAVYMLFQEDCVACHKQVKQLSCLSLPIFLIGSFSSEKGLRKEYIKLKKKYPGYLATPPFLIHFSVNQKLTPQTIVVSKKGLSHFLGLTPCETLKKAERSSM